MHGFAPVPDMVGHVRWDPAQQEEGPDGLHLRLSDANPTGYLNVKKIGNKYYVKIAQTCGRPQRTLPGGGLDTAREAAIRYAQFLAGGERLPPSKKVRPRGEGLVRKPYMLRRA